MAVSMVCEGEALELIKGAPRIRIVADGSSDRAWDAAYAACEGLNEAKPIEATMDGLHMGSRKIELLI